MGLRKQNVFLLPIEKPLFPYNEHSFQINSSLYLPEVFGNLIGFVTEVQKPTPEIKTISGISSYGSLLKINKSDGFSNQNKQQGSQRKVKFHGLIFARFVILQLKQIKGGFLGAIQIFNDEISKQIQYEIGKKNLLQTLKQHLKVYYAFKLKYQEGQSQIAQINQDKNINRIIYKSCSDLDIKILDKIKLLQTSDQKLIIQALLSFLAQATQQYTQILAIEKKVREVNIEYQSKRNIYRMNEQQMLLKKLKSKPYPEHVREQIEVQIKRLGVGAESTVHTKYIEILLEIPWLESTPDVKDIKLAQKILNEDHTGLIQVKQRILQFLAVSFRKSSTKGSVICLHGPPGVGKTTIAKSIAKALGRQFTRISLGGLSDEAQLRGHRRTYLGSLPGALIKALIKAKSNNPVILLDEVEKMGTSVKGGNPEHALLEILDPSQNNTFKDHYVSIPVDLSQVMFICAANSLDMSAPLLNRLELIEVPGYTDQQKFQIAKNHIIPKQLKENGVEELINFQSSALEELIKRSKQMGVRQLQRNVAKVCRRAARINQKDSITGKTVTMIFGNIKNEQRWNGVGVVNSMVWTEKGGKILLVEAVKYHNSKGVIQVTGQLGTVMKQSINIALSWIRTHKNDFSIWSERIFNMSEQIDELEKISLHLHFPAGGIKKDGPSAGITIVVCIVSLLLKVPVRESLSMTGQITLSGQVLPVGGVRYKCLAAINQGIKHIVIPFGNLQDLQKIPEDMRKEINFYAVRTVQQALGVAFPSLLDKIPSKI